MDEHPFVRQRNNLREYCVLFDAIAWQSVGPGARSKVYRRGNGQLRLLELTPEFIEPDWCVNGHVGFVVSGELEIDFNGECVHYSAGSGIAIPCSSAPHKARSISPTVLLFLSEES